MAVHTPPYQVRAVYEYSSPHDDDLSFPIGQVITVTDEEDADWYYGEYVDTSGSKQEGLFPRNFVKMYEPETPPRPTRQARPKKEPEASSIVRPENQLREVTNAAASTAESMPTAVANTNSGAEPPSEEPTSTQATTTSEIPFSAPPTNSVTKPVPSDASKSGHSPTNDKPAGGSFRDRINAFNKPAAPPVAPKPGGSGVATGSGFVKKPFVAPPPSKNAYVPPPREGPPQKIYRREEDPQIVGQADDAEGGDRPAPLTESIEGEEDQPKPTSLKDRIALLQKQQLEQAARNSEAAQKKDKPKRPPKKRVESQERVIGAVDADEGQPSDYPTNSGTTASRSADLGPREAALEGSPITTFTKAEDPSSLLSSARGIQSDANDADQSGAEETEEAEELHTDKDDSNERSRVAASEEGKKRSQAPFKEPDIGDEEDDADEVEEQEEEEEMDPEVKRRMEIRERMAKMSGGMGMAGMFGPYGGMSGVAPKKQTSAASERKDSGHSTTKATESQASHAPPVPIMPMHGMQRVYSPEQDTAELEVDKESSEPPKSVIHGRQPGDMPDVEDMKEEPVVPSRSSLESPALASVPRDRPVPAPPHQAKIPPPPLPTERPGQPLSAESRPVPRPPPGLPMSPSAGSESDDEMSLLNRRSSLRDPVTGTIPDSKSEALPMTSSTAPTLPPLLPHRPREPPPTATGELSRNSNPASTETSPTSPKIPVNSAQRSSRVPPVPVTGPTQPPPPTPHNRAPPPPPPTAGLPKRTSTSDSRIIPVVPQTRPQEDSDEEVTEYEGDYDTDIAPDATHKDALKSHARPASLEGDSTNDEETFHHSGLPSLGLAPRAVPPPPPNQPPRANRQSGDMPRAPPPPPPPPKEQTVNDEEEEYDPYNYTSPRQRESRGPNPEENNPTTPRTEDPEDLYSASPPRRTKQPLPPQNDSQFSSPPSQPSSGRAPPRQSLDVQRTSSNLRRSMDAPRASGEHGSIAGDVDLGHGSQWWRQPNAPPPVFQNRRDVVYEVEESSTTRRGGRQSITRIVYVLYMDYSQTVITALFDAQNPAEVALEQHHEPPPARLRQDQLEDAHSSFGAHIAEEANSKKDTIVGDGSPHGLVLSLLSSLPDALLPVGTRAYGALVYSNLANATVLQFDEIRPGDIVTFRNAKFQGHRGPMHSKYSVEIGKPDHVGVVVDWDGTKKKVRAWEQGRDNKKVKMESYKLGDMRSGEAKVWRVMSRKWVGWEGQN